MTKTLTGIGECMIELSQADRGLLRQSFAGDVINTLWYATRHQSDKWTSSFFSAVGNDVLSDEMLQFITQGGISCDRVVRISDRRPGLYMIHLDGAERSFSYWRDHSAARLLARDKDALSDAIAASDAVYFSGITLAILNDDDARYLIQLLGKARHNGTIVTFDPNIRPALWADAENMLQTITQAAAVSQLVLPSFDDEAKAFGDASPVDTADRYCRAGADICVVKDGSNSVVVHDGNHGTQYPTPPVVGLVDTTGAGDSFNGAFLAAYLEHGDLAAAVTTAQACAARVICHHGALI